MPVESAQRCEVIFHGHVQGVGFRYTTAEVATPYSVCGYVMNERDGTVRLVMEGLRKDVSSMIRAVNGKMGGYITRQEENWGPPTGEFPDFRIRRLP